MGTADGGTDTDATEEELTLIAASDELFALLFALLLSDTSLTSRSADEARTTSTAGDGDRFKSPMIAAGTDSGPAPFDTTSAGNSDFGRN
jgi:hypothetical protein